MNPRFQVQLKIQKPVADVFEAVVNPTKLCGYFVQSSTGPLVEGVAVKWKFAEAPPDYVADVTVQTIEHNARIVFTWPSDTGGYRTLVEMKFMVLDPANCMVQITETGWRPDDAGFKASYGNAGGWMHMMCCLKAYLEYGINLRAGGAL